MIDNGLLIGFDAREMWHYENAKAMNERKTGSRCFLRDGIKKGLSVDTSIWGSVFDTGDCVALVGEERRRAGLGTLELPDWIGDNKPFWKDLSELRNYLSLHDSEIIKPYWIIAVAQFSLSREIESSSTKRAFFEPTKPPVLLPEWKLIGFDIADSDNEAHLTGIGFRGNEQYLDFLCHRWGRRINEYHLFNDLADAFDYTEFETQHNPYNKPYFVYGIWLIKQVLE